jgi:hypothetical protein
MKFCLVVMMVTDKYFVLRCMPYFPKACNVESTTPVRFCCFVFNLLEEKFFVSRRGWIVRNSHSVCELCRHIQVSPTYKLKATDIFHTVCTYPFMVSLEFIRQSS